MPSATSNDVALTGVALLSPVALAAKHLTFVGRITDRLNCITASGLPPRGWSVAEWRKEQHEDVA